MPNLIDSERQEQALSQPLNLKTKLTYGVGEMSNEVPGSILVFFLLFFLTNRAGLNPGLAGSVLLVAKIWDAINDPLVGWLSDRTSSRWGRRYPWMLCGAIPLGVCFCLLWWVPPFASQGLLFGYYVAVTILFYTALTAVAIPYTTLASELTQTYDERTVLVSFKAIFSIASSILALVVARIIIGAIADPKLQYLILGAIAGTVACLATVCCVWGTRQRFRLIQAQRQSAPPAAILPILQQFKVALSNRPFLFVAGIYLCSWLGVQVTAAMLPYYVVNWMGLPEQHFTQMALTVQGTALVMMFVWSYLGQRIGKHAVYCCGVPLTLLAQVSLFLLQPGQVGLMYAGGVLAGLGLSVAYLVPWSLLPDVVDLDELKTGERREGIFFGLVVQLQKVAIALSIFMVGKILDGSGFIAAGADQAAPIQPESALWAIRWLIGPVPSVVLIGGWLLAYFYPLTRQVHGEILLKLNEQRQS
ncbi:MFS transporter [Acaryochloris thomasi]|nr:MFS transporter [Acaryochloris thomasi]